MVKNGYNNKKNKDYWQDKEKKYLVIKFINSIFLIIIDQNLKI